MIKDILGFKLRFVILGFEQPSLNIRGTITRFPPLLNSTDPLTASFYECMQPYRIIDVVDYNNRLQRAYDLNRKFYRPPTRTEREWTKER